MDAEMKEKLASVLRGLFIAAVGAMLPILLNFLSTADLGVWGPILTVLLGVAYNALRKFFPVLDPFPVQSVPVAIPVTPEKVESEVTKQ